MPISPETRFHSWFFGVLIGIIVATSGYLLPFLDRLSGWWNLAAVAGSILVSTIGYQLLAGWILWISRQLPWLLKVFLGSNFIHGYWVGEIRGSSGKTLAIENYKQTPSTLQVNGESYWPNLTLAARWKSDSADIDPDTHSIHSIYQTIVFDNDGNEARRTGGFGHMKIEGNHISGHVVDKPEAVRSGDEKVWIPKTYHYELQRVTSQKVTSTREVKETQEWAELLEKA